MRMGLEVLRYRRASFRKGGKLYFPGNANLVPLPKSQEGRTSNRFVGIFLCKPLGLQSSPKAQFCQDSIPRKSDCLVLTTVVHKWLCAESLTHISGIIT